MPWSGGSFTRTNGVHTGSTLWVQDRDAGTKILATRHDTHDQDLADGINDTLEKSGSNAATGNLDIGSNRLTLVADGTAKTDAATVNQIQSNGPAFQATDTGTANAYVIALSPAITAYAAGQAITFKAANASTTASTLNVNTLGTKVLKKKNDQDIASGDIEASQIVTAVYDGTSFQVTSQLGSEASAGGSDTQVQYNSSGSLAGSANFTFDGTSATVANALFLPDGTASAPALSNTGDTNTGIAFIAADTVGVVTGGTEQFRFGSNPIPGGSKNLVINGGMTASQRPTQAITASAYTAVDMWQIYLASSAGRLTTTQDSTTGAAAPLGHGFSVKLDCTTAEGSLAAGDVITLRHIIEAQNLQQLQWGAASAKDVTLSFWMQSPKSGTHCVALNQPDSSDRHYISEFTVASADTWEHFKITIPGDASGTINNDTGGGLSINFPLVCGSTYQNTGDTWAAGEDYGTSSVQNLLDSTSNNVYVTGVQLEVGSVGTDFAHEDVGTTLGKCWRYLQYNGTLPAGDFDIMGGFAWKAATADTTNSIYWEVDLDAKARMRAAPTFETQGVGAANWKCWTGNRAALTVSVMNGTGLHNAITTGKVQLYMEATGSTDFTVGSPVAFAAGSSPSYYSWSAEL